MSAAAVNLDGSMANMYTLRHQKVHWEVDLERRRLLGKTELHIEVDANVVRGLAQFRLNCRQCKVFLTAILMGTTHFGAKRSLNYLQWRMSVPLVVDPAADF